MSKEIKNDSFYRTSVEAGVLTRKSVRNFLFLKGIAYTEHKGLFESQFLIPKIKGSELKELQAIGS